jgi:hypothetical protein
MNSAGLYIGINYMSCSDSRLKGCVNDVANVRTHLDSIGVIRSNKARILVDEGVGHGLPTYNNIIKELISLQKASWKKSLNLAWIHYSGHGASIQDVSCDELDNKDECIIPCDYKTAGVIIDDSIKQILSQFNPITRVICIFDCCHSGTMADLKYRFTDCVNAHIEITATPCNPKIICLSGCMDRQTSADAYNVSNMRKFSGAMSSCLLLAMKSFPAECKSDVFFLVDQLRENIRKKGFSQLPQLTCSKDLRDDKTFY